MSRWYFAYGSNMNPARVTHRGLLYDTVCAGSIAGMRLKFNKQSREHPGSGHANLVADPRGLAEGVLYRLVDDAEIRLMDRFERAPINYRREIVAVSADGTVIDAWTYLANPGVIRENLRPERAYLAHLLAGRRYLSDAYFAWLSQTVCIDE